jgi:ribosomal protein L18E
MVENLLNLDSASINQEISGLLDFSKKEVKKFIKEFIERVEKQRIYEEKVAISRKKDPSKIQQPGGKKSLARDLSKV